MEEQAEIIKELEDGQEWYEKLVLGPEMADGHMDLQKLSLPIQDMLKIQPVRDSTMKYGKIPEALLLTEEFLAVTGCWGR